MLSTQYRLRLEFICKKIANKEEVKLDDMIWAEKLAKRHTTARDWLNKARRQAAQDIEEGSMDDFCLLYTSPSPRDVEESRMPSSA